MSQPKYYKLRRWPPTWKGLQAYALMLGAIWLFLRWPPTLWIPAFKFALVLSVFMGRDGAKLAGSSPGRDRPSLFKEVEG